MRDSDALLRAVGDALYEEEAFVSIVPGERVLSDTYVDLLEHHLPRSRYLARRAGSALGPWEDEVRDTVSSNLANSASSFYVSTVRPEDWSCRSDDCQLLATFQLSRGGLVSYTLSALPAEGDVFSLTQQCAAGGASASAAVAGAPPLPLPIGSELVLAGEGVWHAPVQLTSNGHEDVAGEILGGPAALRLEMRQGLAGPGGSEPARTLLVPLRDCRRRKRPGAEDGDSGDGEEDADA